MYPMSTSTCSPPPSCRKMCFAIHPFLGRIWKRPLENSDDILLSGVFCRQHFFGYFLHVSTELGGERFPLIMFQNGWKMVEVETQNCLSWNMLQWSWENSSRFWSHDARDLTNYHRDSCLTKVSLDVVSLLKIVLVEYHHVTALQKTLCGSPPKNLALITSYPNFAPLGMDFGWFWAVFLGLLGSNLLGIRRQLPLDWGKEAFGIWFRGLDREAVWDLISWMAGGGLESFNRYPMFPGCFCVF